MYLLVLLYSSVYLGPVAYCAGSDEVEVVIQVVTTTPLEPELVKAFQNVIDTDVVQKDRCPLDIEKMFKSRIIN